MFLTIKFYNLQRPGRARMLKSLYPNAHGIINTAGKRGGKGDLQPDTWFEMAENNLRAPSSGKFE
jgi:hypothetical protein